jgi:hypothetical protein
LLSFSKPDAKDAGDHKKLRNSAANAEFRLEESRKIGTFRKRFMFSKTILVEKRLAGQTPCWEPGYMIALACKYR